MTIKKDAIYQYILIYILLLLNQSVASRRYGVLFNCIAIAISVIIAALRCPWVFRRKAIFLPIIGLSISILVTRMTGGSAGIAYIILASSEIFIAHVSVEVNKNRAVERYIDTISFFAVISLIAFALTKVAPDMMRSILGLSFSQERVFSSGQGWTNSAVWSYYGHWFYSFGREVDRNCSFYTEPGLYAIVLAVGVYLLLYRSNQTSYSNKKVFRRLILLIVTMISAASAAGIMMLCTVFLPYLIKGSNLNNSNSKLLKRRIIPLAIIVILLIMGEYIINGTNSFLFKYVIDKLQTLSFTGALEREGSTGNARIAIIIEGIIAVLRYPFGAGTERMSMIANEFGTENYGAGCGLFYYLGTLGIFGWISLISAFLLPLNKYVKETYYKMPLLCMYLIYGLTQGNFWVGVLLFAVCTFSVGKKESTNDRFLG